MGQSGPADFADGGDGTLRLDHSSSFTGTVSGFIPSATIATIVATGILKPRIQGIPFIWYGLIVIREKFIHPPPSTYCLILRHGQFVLISI